METTQLKNLGEVTLEALRTSNLESTLAPQGLWASVPSELGKTGSDAYRPCVLNTQ